MGGRPPPGSTWSSNVQCVCVCACVCVIAAEVSTLLLMHCVLLCVCYVYLKGSLVSATSLICLALAGKATPLLFVFHNRCEAVHVAGVHTFSC